MRGFPQILRKFSQRQRRVSKRRRSDSSGARAGLKQSSRGHCSACADRQRPDRLTGAQPSRLPRPGLLQARTLALQSLRPIAARVTLERLGFPHYLTKFFKTTPTAYANPAAMPPTIRVDKPDRHQVTVDHLLLIEPMMKNTAPVKATETANALPNPMRNGIS